MAWENILAQIEKVRHIIEAWQQSGAVHSIEKEVALDKLRLVYEAIKFAPTPESAALREATPEDILAQSVHAAQPTPEEKHGEMETASVYETTVKVKHDRKRLMSLYGDDAKAGAYQGGDAEKMPLMEESAEIRSDVVGTPQTVSRQSEPEPETMETSDAAENEADMDILAAIGFAGADNVMTESDNALVETAVGASEPVGGIAEPIASAAAQFHAPTMQDTQTVKETLQPQNNGSDNHKKIFGDTIKAGETLADVYARNNHQEDVAGKLKNGNVTSLRGAIGINDKFLLVRDLFGGSQEAFDKTIRELDSFSDLNDALLYIHDNFNWNPNSDGAKLLVDLLSRKFS